MGHCLPRDSSSSSRHFQLASAAPGCAQTMLQHESVVSLHLPALCMAHGFCGTATRQPGASCLWAGAVPCALATLDLSGSRTHNHIPCGEVSPSTALHPTVILGAAHCTLSHALCPGDTHALQPAPCVLHPSPHTHSCALRPMSCAYTP